MTFQCLMSWRNGRCSSTGATTKKTEVLPSKLSGDQTRAMRIYPKGVTPEVLIGSSSRFAGFPIRAFGNDGL